MEVQTIKIPHQFEPQKRPYQLEILGSPAKNKVIVVHRRAGKTTMAINHLIIEAMKPENAGNTYWYIAPTYKNAKDVVWNNPNMLFKHLPKELIKKKNETELWVKTINNTMIQLKGAENADSLLGANPTGVIMDETQSHDRETYFRLIKPILDANDGWIWFLGTPRIMDFFYEMYAMAHEDSDWQAYHLSAETSKIIPWKTLMKTKSRIPMDIYKQDYLAEFLENDGSVFRNVDDICSLGHVNKKEGHTYVLGVDLARKQDFTVITVFDRSAREIVYIERFQDVDWRIQKMTIESLSRKYHNLNKPAEIRLDSTGVGDPIYQDLRDAGMPVRPMVFTNKLKVQMVTNAQVMFDHKKIKCIKFMPLLGELAVFEETTTPNGSRRFAAPKDGHDDCVMSMLLALYQATHVPAKDRIQRRNLTMDKYKNMGRRYSKRKRDVCNFMNL